jgi:hypothetical protein
MLVHFPAADGVAERWAGVFLKFQSQSWHTDDATGHDITEKPDIPDVGDVIEPQGDVRIVAARPNPAGGAPEQETVTILNTTPDDIDLAGWQIADKNKNKDPLGGTIGAGQVKLVSLSQKVQLSNKGGLITLLNPQGLKIDGVSYTKAQARREGWTVVF